MNTVIDFYVEPGYEDFSCADGGIEYEALCDEHDTWVQILKDHNVPEWHYGEITIEDNVLRVDSRPMDYELSNGDLIEWDQFERLTRFFENSEQAAEVLTGLTADSYADRAEADPADRLCRSFFHALNPHLIQP